MKTLFYTTGTRDCEKLWRSYTNIYPNTAVTRYDVTGLDMVACTRDYAPDVIVYVGAVGDFHGLPVPTSDVLHAVGQVAPMIHVCSDSADPPWWALLNEYHQRGVFALQIGIDGSFDSPIGGFGDRGKVALTPIDPGLFASNLSWDMRYRVAGFCGGGGFREPLIRDLRRMGTPISWLMEGQEVPYDDLCRFYGRVRLVWNDARTGSGVARHVKGRAVEAAMAGAVLVEPADSPLRFWFDAGVDYLQYEDLADAHRRIVTGIHDSDAHDMAVRFRDKMVSLHSAQVFWVDALGRVGVTPT
jgi:hypothetical protein